MDLHQEPRYPFFYYQHAVMKCTAEVFFTPNKKKIIPNSPIIGKFERESNPIPQPPHLYLSRFAFLVYFAVSDKQSYSVESVSYFFILFFLGFFHVSNS